MRKMLGLMSLIGLMGFLPIEPINRIHAQTLDTNTVYLHVDGSTFFVDNEYFGDRLSGYTLPGFVLQPKVEWRLHKMVTLSGGLHWLNYWGAKEYPVSTAYGAYPLYDSTSRPMHLLPWLTAEIRWNEKLTLLLGCIDVDSQDLPFPLYNPEQTLVGDPEVGMQLNYSGSWLRWDLWVDWNDFIWDRSPEPESFTAGASGRLLLDKENWILYLPMNFIVRHEGGQNMSVSHNINNNFNAAAGLGFYRSISEGYWLDASCRIMWYHQHGNAAIPFSNGWGIYPEFDLNLDNWMLTASYWHSKDFIPLQGSWHFSNLSANTEGLTFDYSRVVSLHAEWRWTPTGLLDANCRLSLYGTLYHYLPSTGTFADGTTKEYGHRNQFSFGASLSFNPTIKLH